VGTQPVVEHQDSRLYDTRGIDLATFFGSWFAGAFLASRNLKALGRPDDARNALFLGFFGLIPLGLVTLSIVVPVEYERPLTFAIQGVQVWVVHVATVRVLGADLKHHAASGGQFYSRWRAVGMALLLLPLSLGFLLAIAFAFPNLPALQE
jgi:hypothetical protein